MGALVNRLDVSSALANARIHSPPAPTSQRGAEKAWKAAREFEAVFLNSMFQQMTSGLEGEGPFGGASGAGVWRSFLTDEYAKSFAMKGGVGIADHVYRALLQQQEASR